jgi:quercetin dioxygenase-like cupin family protein
MTAPTPIFRADGEGERLGFAGGGIHTWKATSAETAGAFLLFEDATTQGKMTPLHRHPEADETLYVLEGELLVHIGGEEHRVGPGGFTMAPRGVPHAFTVISETARMLCLQTPGSADTFFRGASEPAADATYDSGPVDFDRVRAAAAASDFVEILGPPPFTPPASAGGA